MESSRLHIELCEAVLDTIPSAISWPVRLHYPYCVTTYHVEDHILSQKTLCACALVCRAWRPRAQFLLWKYPILSSPESLARFVATIHHDVGKQWASFVSMLHLYPHRSSKPGASMKSQWIWLSVSDVFMQCFPNMRTFYASHPGWMANSRLYHMRLPFFSSVTHLVLDGCTYETLRDMIWSCHNLAILQISDCLF
ncbi:hypothetical protein BD414DRAFT_388950, partial [Trametes punicea]